MDYKEKLEIDLFDLAHMLLKKWKVIIAWAFITAICFSIFGYLSLGSGKPSEQVDAKGNIIDKYGIIESRNVLSDASAAWVEEELIIYLRKIHKNEEHKSSIDMTASERAYYQALYATIINNMNREDTTSIDAWLSLKGLDELSYAPAVISDISQKVSAETVVDRSFDIKYLVIGFFAGAIMAVICYAIKYVMVPVLKTADDIPIAFEVPVIGEVDKQDDYRLIVSSIVGIAKKHKANNVMITGTANCDKIESIINSIIKNIEDRSISIISKGNVLSDYSSVDKAAESDAVVLMERIGVSKYNDIAREIEALGNLDVIILGAIVIR